MRKKPKKIPYKESNRAYYTDHSHYECGDRKPYDYGYKDIIEEDDEDEN